MLFNQLFNICGFSRGNLGKDIHVTGSPSQKHCVIWWNSKQAVTQVY